MIGQLKEENTSILQLVKQEFRLRHAYFMKSGLTNDLDFRRLIAHINQWKICIRETTRLLCDGDVFCKCNRGVQWLHYRDYVPLAAVVRDNV